MLSSKHLQSKSKAFILHVMHNGAVHFSPVKYENYSERLISLASHGKHKEYEPLLKLLDSLCEHIGD